MGEVVRQSSVVSFFSLAGVGISFITTFWLLPLAFPDRPEDFGLVKWVVSVAILLGWLLHSGLPQTVITFYPRWTSIERAQFFTYGWTVIGILTFIASASIELWLRPWLESLNLSNELTLSAVISVIFMGFAFSIHEWYLSWYTVHGRMTLPQVVKDFGRKSSLLIAVVVFLVFQPDLSTLLIGLSVWYLILTAILVIIYHNRERETFGVLSIQPEGHYYALWLLGSFVTQMVFGQLDILLLGRWVGLDEVARYSIAFQIGIVLGVPSKSINQAIRPIVAQYWAQDRRLELSDLMLRSSRNQWGLSLLLYTLMLAALPAVYQLLPDVYQDRGPLIAAVAGATQMIYIATGATGMVLLTSEKYKHDLYANLLMIAMSVGFAALSVPSHGAVGMAWSLFTAALIYNMFRTIQLWRWFRISAFNLEFWRFIPWVGLALVVHFVIPFYIGTVWVQFSVESVVQILLFLGLNSALKFAPDLRPAELYNRWKS